MAIRTSLGRWVMRLAQRAAPAARYDFALAMREEFEVMDGDRLGWALGCLATAAGWRLRADGLFLATLVAVGLTLDLAMDVPLMLLPGDFVHAVAYVYWLAAPAVVCGMLAAWRPGYAYVATLVVWLVRETLLVATSFSMFRALLDRGWHVMDAPPIVGYSALLGWSLVAATIGAHLGRRRIAKAAGA